jgi:hypothetical protein
MKKQDDIFDKLDELKKEPPFDVPENYFDTFHDRLKDRIGKEAKRDRPGIVRTLRPWMAVAAGFIVVAVLYITFFNPVTNTNTAFSDNELIEEFDEAINDPILLQLNEYDIACYLSDCDQPASAESANDEIDLTGLTMEDIDDLILF